jgi:hypothetical protein
MNTAMMKQIDLARAERERGLPARNVIGRSHAVSHGGTCR